MTKKIRVGSRESALALAQSKWVINEIKKKHPLLEFELVGITTSGDIMLDSRLDKIGGKGLFIKELEAALINNSIDIAIHSLKDMPAEVPLELKLAAFSKREDPRDVLITKDGKRLDELRDGAVIGTSSIRRELQILKIRPDLRFKCLRGNVLTRINKLINGEYDAIVLASAGLKRLGQDDSNLSYFSINEMIPAVGQGILAIETRKDDDVEYLLDSINCEEASFAAHAERAFMIRLNGGCTTPMAAYASVEGDTLKMYGMLATDDRRLITKSFVQGNRLDAIFLGEKLAEMVLSQSQINTD